jgi:thiosulfate/3-mercaptopyruvate sulfurtransferase
MSSRLPPVLPIDGLRACHGEVVLLDARGGPEGRADYLRGHLRGAHHADLDRDLAGPAEAPERGGRHPLPDVRTFCERVARWGILPSSRVVVYDAQGGGNAAARAWWMLRAIGQREVSVLDGGYARAVEVGLSIETEEPTPTPVPPRAAGAWGLPLVDTEGVDAARRDPSFVLLDVRSHERFAGEAEPIDPIAGHIPGARNLFWGDALDASGSFRSVDELRALLGRAFGEAPAGRRIVHCGSGVTACHTLLALEHAGLGGAALYVGSWSEWCRSGRDRAP